MGAEDQGDGPRTTLAGHIQEAVEKLVDEDILLRQSVNERLISNRLAIHLEEVLNEKNYLDEYPHVDIEYNRIGDEDNPVSKRLHDGLGELRGEIKEVIKNCNENPEVQVEEILGKLQERLVYPDIIVHERGESQNLLVIEVKTGTNPELEEEDIFDHAKLMAYTTERQSNLNYNYGTFLKLRVEDEASSIKEAILCSAWFENGEKREDNPLSD